MESRSLKYIRQGCRGELLSGNPQQSVSGICTDSRRLQHGELFFALRGDRFDGHAFAHEAARKGAAALVLEKAHVPATLPDCPVIAVDDARAALGRLAAHYRSDFNPLVLAVAGSNGKTTTKELVASVLSQHFRTLWSEGSFNNDVGVPVTLLKLERTHGAAVLEVGTNHPGELAPLLRMIQPRHGIITNIGREHLEFFDDLAGVAQEEGWLAELLPQSGTLFLNGDNPWTPLLEKRTTARVERVGFEAQNDWRAKDVRMQAAGLSFTLSTKRLEYAGEYQLQLLGRHQALNALFAIAAGALLGLSAEEIRRGLAACKPAKMRMQVFTTGGITVLDDAYNANADSVQAGLQTLRDYPGEGRRVAVLGAMEELGAHSAAAHEEAGRTAARYGVDALLVVGRWAECTAEAARSEGLQAVQIVPDLETAVQALKAMVQPGDVVLLKASRAAGFERISQALRA